MHKLKILSLMSLALVSGCSMAPDDEKPTVAMNDTYLNAQYVDGVTTNKQDPNEHTWWSQFNDEKLNQLVARAQQQNINSENGEPKNSTSSSISRSRFFIESPDNIGKYDV